jgi:hypothetical protein
MIYHELMVQKYLNNVVAGMGGMSRPVLDCIVKDVTLALEKQLVDSRDPDFRLRMSNIGRSYCQLWFDKNEPTGSLPFPNNFLMNMILGDLVEAVMKGVLTEAGVVWQDGEHLKLELGKHSINGTPDLIIDGAVWDIKSCSPWAYTNKWKDFATVKEHDSFGYVGQLVGYSTALGLEAGGWIVVNKANGQFKFITAEGIDMQAELDILEAKADLLVDGADFERCYKPVKETFRRVETGNLTLCVECGFCQHKYKCWDTLEERTSIPSQAKNPAMVNYIYIKEAEE